MLEALGAVAPSSLSVSGVAIAQETPPKPDILVIFGGDIGPHQNAWPARAWLAGAGFVAPGDVQAIAPGVLRHRVGPSCEERGQEVGAADAVLAGLLTLVAPA